MQSLRVFCIHTSVFAAGMVLIFLVNLATNAAAGIAGHWWAWWSAWAFIGWSFAVGIHGLVVWPAPLAADQTWNRDSV